MEFEFGSQLKNKDGSPFKFGKKIDAGHNSEVFESEQDKNKLIKKLKVMTPEDIAPLVTSHFDEQQLRDHYQKNLLEMKENFGSYLPDIQLVFGEGEIGYTTGYIITERITEDEEPDDDGKLSKLDGLLTEVITYFLKQAGKIKTMQKIQFKHTRIPVPDFIGPRDILYGHTQKQPDPKFYLPDIYPMPIMTPVDLKFEITEIIKKYPGYDFPKTRTMLQELQKLVNGEKNLT